MLEGKAMIQDTDMPLEMQLQAMSFACEALDLFDVLDCRSIAGHIKKSSDFQQSNLEWFRLLSNCSGFQVPTQQLLASMT
ncbi:hypothetical protein ZIOFF_029214 [Zingiber officinale]|uniref:Dynein light chain n=1 Tax=Zingiber officinale TaxID=94328 RepID=A0A8J5H114_ZINOF|nr:hypothetical protein ZIOFF_029214 [Zingiber officinale]